MATNEIHHPHNPESKLVAMKRFKSAYSYLEFVYSETNEGENQGLEVYFFRHKDDTAHYTSRRFLEAKVPAKYKEVYDYLKRFSASCLPGHMLHVK